MISDEALVEALNKGDRSAFEALYHRYRDWVVNLAFRFCGNREDALDVLQEAFTYVYRKFPGFELRAKMKTFLYPTVKHLALSRKSKRRHARLEQDVEHTPAADTTDEVEKIIADLPEEQRETIWLRFVDGLELREIADAMDVPLGTVKSRLHKAMQTLREKRKNTPEE